MCNTCKLNFLKPEFEAMLHNEYEEGLYRELEWGNYTDMAKNYAGRFFNRHKGSSLNTSTGYTGAKLTNATSTSIYPQPQTEIQLVKKAMANGERNENTLSDLLFFKRHPHLSGQPLSTGQPNFTTLSKEWLRIRDSIVRPALQTPSSPPSTKPGPSTPGGSDTFLQIPVSGTGYTRKVTNGQTQHEDRVWGHPKVINALVAIGAKWYQLNHSAPRIQIGDISFKNGGLMDPHTSHQKGLDVDIRPIRTDGMESPVRYFDTSYSRALTQKLVDVIRSNGILGIRNILFNDSAVAGVTRSDGHDDHLHVSFNQS